MKSLFDAAAAVAEHLWDAEGQVYDDLRAALNAERDRPTYASTFIVRHDNAFDFPSTWAFTDFDEARKLRDRLNEGKGRHEDQYHVEEEVHFATAEEVIAELQREGWFDED